MKPQMVWMHLMGHFFENLYRVPRMGDSLVRSLAKGMARGTVLLPFTGFRRPSSVEESIALLSLICRRMAISVDIVGQKPDGFLFEVPACPYGYNRPDQQGVCDAVMDLDRLVYRHFGLELTILESVVAGAPRCRMSMRQL